MSEDLVKSTTSQRSNPRVLRRVRPVPYECCGGVCSFLNSGCFTLCCNGSKTRRRSSVYVPRSLAKEENDGGGKDDELEELSETTKRLIKPKSQDFLTEEDLHAFDRSYNLEDSDESPSKQHFVNEFDIELDETPRKIEEDVVEHVEETNIDKEDEVSVLTDDTSISGGDGSAKKSKKKNKIMKILKMGKLKKKNKDGISVTSSASSLACSEISEDQGDVQNLEIESTIIERSEATLSVEKKDEVSRDEMDKSTDPSANEKGGTLGRRLQFIFASMRSKKGSGTSSKAEGVTEESPQPELEINLNKKPFWKTFSKKDKKKDNKEIINGIKPDSIQTTSGSGTDEVDNKIEVGTDVINVDGVNKTKEELPDSESKKKTLLGTLKLTKKEGQQNAQQIPCLFSACVNSNIKPEAGRKLSSDSVEVKTIADDELEGDAETIKIVRNDFFPAEVRTTDDHLLGNKDVVDGVDNTEQDRLDGEIEKENDDPEDTFREESVQGVDNENDQMVFEGKSEEENSQLADSPTVEKQYYIFEKEDFSESLHTLVDNDDPDNILLAPSSALVDTSLADDAKSKKYPEEVEKEANILDEGTFRTSCSLSIEASEEFRKKLEEEAANVVQEPQSPIISNEEETELDIIVDCTEETILVESELKEEIVEDIIETEIITEKITSSSDTLTESKISVTVIEKSTETVKVIDKESVGSSWIDVANVDDLSESKFNYIYKTTLRTVQTGGATLEEEPYEGEENWESPNKIEGSENKENEPDNCEICGKSIQEDTEEVANDQEKAKCVCTTLTKPRQSLTEIEEGSVKSKVEAFNQSKNPIMFPLANVEIVKKDDVTISEAHSSPTLGSKSKSATPSPIAVKSRSGTLSSTNSEWQHAEEDIDRMIQSRGSLSGLGLRSDSMASVYSGAGEGRYGTVAVRGQVEFGLQYNYKAGALEVHVKQCKDLAPVDTKRNRSDPYVKVYLLPDKSKSGKRKTKVKKHTLNPVFDETLKFHISLNGLETRTLWLTVWHSDMFGRNDFLGEVMMTLENKVFDDPAPVWYNLQERTEPFDDTISFKGDIIVCLKFVPPDMTVQKKGKRSRGTLHVLVKEAKYLTAYKANGTSDPFCKSYLLPDKGRNSKQKTPVVKKTVNPVWNHTFIYEDVTLQELAERCLELTVWDHDRLASNEFLGGVRFSLGTGKHYGKPVEWMDATGKEMSLWKSMLERPNFWVEGCLSLRPSLDARTT